MGAAHYIVLEKEIEGLDTGMDGKSLSKNMDMLDEAAEELGVRPLSSYFSMPPEELEEFMEDSEIKLPSLQQFSAQEGLETVKALLAHNAVHVDNVLDDLRDCERILAKASAGIFK